MTEHWFYHLESATIEGVLPTLLEKSLAKGWRVIVKTPPERIGDMDTFLWTYKDDSFLPHGRDDEPLAEHHPIQVSATAENPNGADVIILVDGTDMSDPTGAERCIFMINGRSEEAVQAARARWIRLKDENVALSYWQQNERGQWIKKA